MFLSTGVQKRVHGSCSVIVVLHTVRTVPVHIYIQYTSFAVKMVAHSRKRNSSPLHAVVKFLSDKLTATIKTTTITSNGPWHVDDSVNVEWGSGKLKKVYPATILFISPWDKRSTGLNLGTGRSIYQMKA